MYIGILQKSTGKLNGVDFTQRGCVPPEYEKYCKDEKEEFDIDVSPLGTAKVKAKCCDDDLCNHGNPATASFIATCLMCLLAASLQWLQ